ncbi:cupin domain-containing protein [Dongia soli]|uniref:Cupin domain-containing protein n=1 Tax=Dongia soli TaxID=600628 RepID=A0ABU5E5H1_9PROT|nr:cupin domain-containing protein [Dongia soli]MDY0881532.1 cupin domain-containing protein [Dongia soli]
MKIVVIGGTGLIGTEVVRFSLKAAMRSLRLLPKRGATQTRSLKMLVRLLWVIIFATLGWSAAFAQDSGTKAKVTVVFDHVLPNVPGKSMKGVLVEYGPGGSSHAHTHPRSAFIYATVLTGSIRSQINDGSVKVYHAGENFFEMPGDRHGVSANASDTEPASLLAVFVVDTNDTKLVIDTKD